jgi:hypothetical protein
VISSTEDLSSFSRESNFTARPIAMSTARKEANHPSFDPYQENREIGQGSYRDPILSIKYDLSHCFGCQKQ